ncbi:MAG: efflux RND transporter periplasmic adaptor subunit [Limnochordia bacterium]|jgi:HlyD family secretion protein
MAKRKWIVIVAIILTVLIGATGFARWWTNRKTAAWGPDSFVRTAQVQRRTLSSVVDAIGELRSMREEASYNAVPAKVIEVLVSPGQIVKPGQVLVRFETDDAERALEDALQDLELARARLASARDDHANAPRTAEIQLQRARQELLNAKLKLESLLAGPTEEELEQARANVRQAQISLRAAEEELTAQRQLYEAGLVPRMEYQQYVERLEIAKDNLTNAQLRQNSLLKGPDPKEKEAAESAVQQAEVNLLLAEEAVAKAASAEAVIQAEAEVRRMESAVETARKNLDSLTLKAPFEAMVLQLNAVVGTELSTSSSSSGERSPVVTLAAVGEWQVVAYVDESDLSLLEPGQQVQVTLAALEDRPFRGRLTAIGGEARVSQNVVTYPIYVELSEHEPLFRPGMTADIVVQVLHKPNVLVLPDPAIIDERGVTTVLLASNEPNGEPTPVRIETGLKGNGFTEILSGLQEGQTVIIPGRQAGFDDRRSGGAMQRMMFR